MELSGFFLINKSPLWVFSALLLTVGPHRQKRREEHQTGYSKASLGTYSMDKMILDGSSFPHSSNNGPYFDPENTKNITSVTGARALLNCRVYNLGNRTVSWIRLSDLNLLTVGRYTYTSDLRFEGIHQKYSPDWKLVLNGARISDSGLYECQVSTTPHISRLMSLKIKDPETTFLGGPEMFLDTSSMVNLTCVISWTVSSPGTVTWFHNHTKLTIRGPRTGVSIMVDKSEVTTVSLILQTASENDSGLYECQPDNAPSASMFIHVLRGEQTAQLSSGNQRQRIVFQVTILVIIFLNL